MKEREIAVTNDERINPGDGRHISVNGQLVPRPSEALTKIQDNLGSPVPIPPRELIAAIARQVTAEGASNDPPASSEASQQYETTEQ